MQSGRIYTYYVFVFMLSFLLPLGINANASTSHTAHITTYLSQSNTDFPVVDPNYIYNQLAYTTTNFQERQAGYVANAGHDQFAAYWSQEMLKNLHGFGPQVRQDQFPIHGWRDSAATLPAFNMEVSVPGLTHPEQEGILGCHYDGKANSEAVCKGRLDPLREWLDRICTVFSQRACQAISNHFPHSL